MSLVPKGKRALLVVDEAQNLAPAAIEELRMLSNFQLKNKALLQSFLVGQPELRQLMRSARMQQLRQRVIASYHLGPLDRDETRAYIEHRLKHVDWKGDPEFSDGVFDRIHEFTGGIPRRINTFCTRALLAAFLAEQHVISARHIEQVVAELNEEFGEGAPVHLDAAVSDTGVGASLKSAGTEQAPHSAAPGVATSSLDIARLERRIAGLEKAVATTVHMLRQLLASKRPEDVPEKRKTP